MDAVCRLVNEGSACCSFSNLIVEKHQQDTDGSRPEEESDPNDDVIGDGLNPNQVRAVDSSDSPLALIWGPPGIVDDSNINGPEESNCSAGTGKTTVVVKILQRLFKALGDDEKILMTASTHNGMCLQCSLRLTLRYLAVDNVLERFIRLNAEEDLVPNDKILRVATDSSKVNKSLQDYTIDARVGGDMSENNRFVKQAQQRVKSAKIVFTTCAGAGLGILRKTDFKIAIIDEASQITEACALIPLVKGCRNAVLVGDQ